LRHRLQSRTTTSGSDAIGDYEATTFAWKSKEGTLWNTAVRFYAEQSAAVFQQQWPSGQKVPGTLLPSSYAPTHHLADANLTLTCPTRQPSIGC